MKQEITIQLNQQIDFHLKGREEVGTFITIQAPTSRNMVLCTQLKQEFLKALIKLQKSTNDTTADETETTEKEGVTASEIVGLLYGYSDDFSKMMLHMSEILKGIGKINGEVKITQTLIDSISLNDLENLMGEYIANFIYSSI